MEYYLAIKKDKIMPFAATWMELETLILSEIRKTPYGSTYMWSLKYGTNDLSTKQKQIMDMEGRLLFAMRERGERGTDGEFGISRCTWNGLALRSYCMAQGTISNHL